MRVRRLVVALVATVAMTGLTACSGSPEVSATGGEVAASAPTAGAHLEPADFAAALKRSGTTVLDVRTPAEFAAGHLPGAVNLDISAPDAATRLATLDPGAPYAVYCHSGNRSGAALREMAAAGFVGAYDLAGGIGAWQAAGGEVVTG